MSANTTVLCICFFIMPLSNLLWLIWPVDVIGKNFWLLINVAGLFYVYLTTVFRSGLLSNLRDELNLAFVFVAGFLIFFIKYLIYGDANIINLLRMSLMFFLYISIFGRFVSDDKNYKVIVGILLATVLFQAGLGIAHSNFFPGISVPLEASRDDLTLIFNDDDPKTREGGSLGSSIYANVILCGMFVLLKLSENSKKIASFVLIGMALVFFTYAIYLSGSRYPIIISLVLMAVFAKRLIVNGSGMALILIGLMSSFFAFSFPDSLQYGFISRFSEDSGGRVSKALLSISLLFDDLLSFLIGPPTDVYVAAISEDGYSISDNSYLEYCLFFGVFYAAFYFYRLLSCFLFFRPFLSALFGAYVLICLGLTNCVFWDQWLVIVAATLSILNYKQVNPSFKIRTMGAY